MSDLADFLLARIAEDEAVARAAVQNPAPADADAVFVKWSRHDTGWVPAAGGEWVEGSALLARFDPARALAECDAKRRIMKLHKEILIERLNDEFPGDSFDALCAVDNDDFPCATLSLLALSYADHMDWRQEWRP